MEEKELYRMQRHIRLLLNKVDALEATINNHQGEINTDFKVKFEEWYTKFYQEDKELESLNKRLGL